MSYYDMKPIPKPHNTDRIGGRPAAPNESGVIGGKVHGIPVSKSQEQIVSVWKCASIWWRIKFLFKGEITLTVLGQKQPAVAISVGDTLDGVCNQ